MKLIKKIVKTVFPPHKGPGRFIKKQAAKLGFAKDVFYDEEYASWIAHTEPHIFLPIVDSKVTFSVVIPCYNPKEKYIAPLFNSLINQTYEHWEAIVADGSRDHAASSMLKEYCKQDKRFKYFKFTEHTDISGNTNQGIEKASGDYIVFCDHDDTLSNYALNEVVAVIEDNPETDVIYSDEDKLSDNGRLRHSPYFKPDWSPHLFLYTNYTNHLSVVRSELVREVGGLQAEYNGSQDYDFLLRLHATNKHSLHVKHIPKILYHWREADGSTAIAHGQKSYASDAAQRALERYFEQTGIDATVQQGDDGPGYFKQVIRAKSPKRVTVRVNACSDVRSNDAVVDQLKTKTISAHNVTYVSGRQDGQNSDITVEVNAVAYPVSPSWLDELVGALELPFTAAAAPRILRADMSRVVDVGLVKDSRGNLLPIHKGHGFDDLTIAGGAVRVRNVDELTGSVIAYRTSDGQKKKSNTYYVIWSPVVFGKYEIFGEQGYFNPNLRVTDDDRITVNE